MQFQPQLVLVCAGFDAAVGDMKVNRPGTSDRKCSVASLLLTVVCVCVCVCSGGDVCASRVLPRSDPHVDEFGRGTTRSGSGGETFCPENTF